jgi:MoxR-like ATPase
MISLTIAEEILDALTTVQALRIYFIIFCTLIIAVAVAIMISSNRRKKTTIVNRKIIQDENVVMPVSGVAAPAATTAKPNGMPLPQQKDEAKAEGDFSDSRFPTLSFIDATNPVAKHVVCDSNLTLESIADNFRMYAAGELHLYYSKKDIRSFIASLACSRIILLQGMSGTGKTSLPVAFGKFISCPTSVVPVQPTWKERSDLLGYYNEFTGKFSETPLLTSLYRAGTSDSIRLIVLDEVNIARVEYYFAEFLSLLELPDQNSRILQVASSGMENDPERMINGALLLPENVWFIGTANNDDSTFAISDKVYDRASVLDLDTRAAPFDAEGGYERKNITIQRINRLNAEAQRRYGLTQRELNKISSLDRYLRETFQVSFGNRIMRQIRVFVPVYVACGGTSAEALDVILAKKVLRKLSSCNPVLVKAKSGELMDLIGNLFGSENAPECISAVKKIAENG